MLRRLRTAHESGVAVPRGTGRLSELAGRFAAYVAIALLLIVAAVGVQSFFKLSNLATVAIQAAVLGIVSIGQTLVLLVTGLDMSVSAVMALGAVIVVSSKTSGPSVTALGEAFALAVAIGLANGFLVTKRGVPPFIATFGMLVFVEGARLAYTHGQARGSVPVWMRTIGAGRILHVPWAAVIWVLLTLVLAVVLRYTRYGRWIFAVGANRDAALYAGVPVDGVTIACYVACSLLAIFAGVMLSGYLGYVDQYLGADANLNSIAASIIGGTTFSGGRGDLLGTAAGTILMSMLLNLVVVAGLAVHWEYVVEGLVLLLAIAVQGLRNPPAG